MTKNIISFLTWVASCGGVARENGTYFVNPNHPESTDGTGSCQLTILKLHPEICQIRLDFEQFALAGKNTEINVFLLPILRFHFNSFRIIAIGNWKLFVAPFICYECERNWEKLVGIINISLIIFHIRSWNTKPHL